MKFRPLPNWRTGGEVDPRDVEMVFASADKAHLTRHEALTGTQETAAIPMERARQLWTLAQQGARWLRPKMVRIPEGGPFAFVVMNPGPRPSYTRVSLWGVP